MKPSQNAFPFEVAPEAIAKAKSLLARRGTPTSVFRVGVKGGGCSGLEYVFRIDDQVRAGDLEFGFEGGKLVCDPKSAGILEGARLVASDNLFGPGFQFENPNALRQCGCGTSFTPKPR